MAIRAKWIGDPSDKTVHYSGIPARDLEDPDDWDGLDADQKELVRKSPLYEYVSERAHTPAKAVEGKG